MVKQKYPFNLLHKTILMVGAKTTWRNDIEHLVFISENGKCLICGKSLDIPYSTIEFLGRENKEILYLTTPYCSSQCYQVADGGLDLSLYVKVELKDRRRKRRMLWVSSNGLYEWTTYNLFEGFLNESIWVRLHSWFLGVVFVALVIGPLYLSLSEKELGWILPSILIFVLLFYGHTQVEHSRLIKTINELNSEFEVEDYD